jgi:methionine aminotransferase
MSKMAAEYGAINLSQGFPDFPVSRKIIELIYKYMKAGHNQYAPMPGVLALRSVIAQVIQQTYQRAVDPDTEITITAGGTEALFSAIAALVKEGDEVILFDPCYDSYDPAVRLNGGVPVHLPLNLPDFTIPWQAVEDSITPRTRLVLINSPHNPSGSVITRSDMQKLATLAEAHDLIVLSDEVYERIIFDCVQHESVLSYPSLAKRSVAIFSFGKTFHATGWKVGYAVAPAPLSYEIRKAHQFITFSVNTPTQMALAEFMQDADSYLHLGSFYQRKRDYFLAQIEGTAFEPLPCHGSYFQLLSYSNITTKSDTELAQWMTKELKLASITVSAFYQDRADHHLLRFCFAKEDETLRSAGEILHRVQKVL